MDESKIEALAERILNASGSSLRHYTMTSTREAILKAVREAYMAGWASNFELRPSTSGEGKRG